MFTFASLRYFQARRQSVTRGPVAAAYLGEKFGCRNSPVSRASEPRGNLFRPDVIDVYMYLETPIRARNVSISWSCHPASVIFHRNNIRNRQREPFSPFKRDVQSYRFPDRQFQSRGRHSVARPFLFCLLIHLSICSCAHTADRRSIVNRRWCLWQVNVYRADNIAARNGVDIVCNRLGLSHRPPLLIDPRQFESISLGVFFALFMRSL